MKIEEFSIGDSVVHRLDPRSKIIVVLVFSVVVALSQSIQAAMIAMVFPGVLLILARVNMWQLLLRLAVVNGFILFLWLFLPFTVPGRVVYTIGPLEVHWEGILFALLITLKSNAILLMVIALLGTSRLFNLVHALSHLGIPNKLVHLFFFCFRYVHVIHEEYHRLMDAAKIRGFKPASNMHTYKTYAYLMAMLLVRSFDRSQRILSAMKCRGFNGRLYILHHYEMGRGDYVLTASGILFSTCLVIAV
ncbi:cobalt ECF transporter T component CbiQ [Thermodesulfobacteriota bacterium]